MFTESPMADMPNLSRNSRRPSLSDAGTFSLPTLTLANLMLTHGSAGPLTPGSSGPPPPNSLASSSASDVSNTPCHQGVNLSCPVSRSALTASLATLSPNSASRGLMSSSYVGARMSGKRVCRNEKSDPRHITCGTRLSQYLGRSNPNSFPNAEHLRYKFLNDVVAGKCRCGLVGVDNKDTLFRLRDNENLLAFETSRYTTSPLIINGATAGPDLAASGMFADLLRLGRAFVGLQA